MATGSVIVEKNELAHRRWEIGTTFDTTWIQNKNQAAWPIMTADSQTILATHEGVWRLSANTWSKALNLPSPIPAASPTPIQDRTGGNGSFVFPPRLWPADPFAGTLNAEDFVEGRESGSYRTPPRGIMVAEIEHGETQGYTIRILRHHYVAANAITIDPPVAPDFNWVTQSAIPQQGTTDLFPQADLRPQVGGQSHLLPADWRLMRHPNGANAALETPADSPLQRHYRRFASDHWYLADLMYPQGAWESAAANGGNTVTANVAPTLDGRVSKGTIGLYPPTGHHCPILISQSEATDQGFGYTAQTINESQPYLYYVGLLSGAVIGETVWRQGSGFNTPAGATTALLVGYQADNLGGVRRSDYRVHDYADIYPGAGVGVVWQPGNAVGMCAVLRDPPSGADNLALIKINGWNTTLAYASVALPPGTAATQFDRILIATDESRPWGDFLIALIDFRYSQGDGTVGSNTVGSGAPLVWANRYCRNDNAWEGWTEFTDNTWAITDYPSPILCWQQYMPDGTGRLAIGRHQGADSPGQTLYYELAANLPPRQPSLASVTSPLEVTLPLTLDWTFNDPNLNDTQAQVQIERTIGDRIEFRRTNGEWGTDIDAADTRLPQSETQLNLLTGWGLDSDSQHAYRVRVWDNHFAGPSPWSDAVIVVPTLRINPVITAPTELQVVPEILDLVWTAATQGIYRIRVFGDAAQTQLISDTGQVFDTAARNRMLTMDSNGVDRWIRLDFWNADFYQGDSVTRRVRVSFTPPVAPTIILTPDNTRKSITATITPANTTGLNPPPPLQTGFHLFRRESALTESEGIRVATFDTSEVAVWHDFTVASEVDYAYRARVFSGTGASALGDWVV